jgi:TRAP-type C4-dicarboxylate transport system permease small subunit
MSVDLEIEIPAAEVTGMQRGFERLANAAIAVAALALVGLVLVQGWQVIARYVLNDSPSWTEPLTLLLLSTAMSLGAAAGVHTRRHFGFFLLADALGPRLQKLMHALSPLVIAVIGASMAWWGVILLVDGYGIRAAGANLPQSINYLPLAIGGALMVVFALNQLFLVLTTPHAGEAR